MATSTLKILREVNDYTQEFVAEDVLSISQTTYARLEQNPSKITAEQAKKLSDLYKVDLANILTEATPIITFQPKAISENINSANGYIQTNNIQASNENELTKSIKTLNELVLKQNGALTELVKILQARSEGDR